MIPLLLSLTAIGVALFLPKLLKFFRERKAKEALLETAKQAQREAEKQKKIRVIQDAGGLLAKEFKKIKSGSSDAFEVLYLAASQQDIRFDLAIERSLRVVPYPSANMDYVQITDASQLPLVSLDQMILDDDLFYRKFATRDLMCPEYYDVVEKFKRLYILLDISESMFELGARMPDGHMRDTWARGVVASLLVDAINGQAEYLFRPFSNTVHDLKSATIPEEAEKLLSLVVNNPERGSGTNIGNAVRTAVENVRKRQTQESRMNHILLITDGDDQAGLTREHLIKALGEDIKLHVVLIGTSWPETHPLSPYVIAKY